MKKQFFLTILFSLSLLSNAQQFEGMIKFQNTVSYKKKTLLNIKKTENLFVNNLGSLQAIIEPMQLRHF